MTEDEVATFIKTVYRGLLKREPDPTGLANYTQLVKTAGFAGVEQLLRDAVESPEFRLQRPVGNIVMPQVVEGPPVNYIMSLGGHCLPATLMKREGLKMFSGPFDWIFSNLGMVTHCLTDDFFMFLDRSQYEPVPISQRPSPEFYRCHHKFYRDHFGVSFVFNHNDAAEEPDYQYYIRCVTRFRQVLRQAAPEARVLLFHFDATGRETMASFRAAAKAVDEYSNGLGFIVSISVASGGYSRFMPELRLIDELPRGHLRFALRPTCEEVALTFADPLNEIAMVRVLRSYNLHLKSSV